MPDTTGPVLTAFQLPGTIDLAAGTEVSGLFSASASDETAVRSMTVWFDRDVSDESWTYSFVGLYDTSDWQSGSDSRVVNFLPHNKPGTVTVDHVTIEDVLGNVSTYTNKQLAEQGFQTSFEISGSTPDTTAPVLTGLVLPDQIDTRSGNTPITIAASAADTGGIESVVVWLDRDISYGHGSAVTGFNDWRLMLIGTHGDPSAEWQSSQQLTVSSGNYSGPVDIARVTVTDRYGNERDYSNDELRALGFATQIDVLGNGAAPTGPTVQLSCGDVLRVREGTTPQALLDVVGLTSGYVHWGYQTSIAGGTADYSDLQAAEGSGWSSLAGTGGAHRLTNVPITALRDDTQEGVEAAFLTVVAEGGARFADGGTMKVIRIEIIDDNLTTGTAYNDSLRGTSKAETLTGLAGNDTYYVNAGDRVVEAVGEGNDSVVSTATHLLASNVENLTLTGAANINGTGNALNNLIIGNSGANQLRGEAGVDMLQGGAGNDTYFTDGRDTIIEAANAGTDTVISSVSATLGANLENLTLSGTGNYQATGNTLANRLVGNTGNNLIVGAGGKDSMFGGAGNDTYVVDGDDVVIEAANGGTDTVRAFANHTLGANIENLSLGGGAGYSATGNMLANQIIGNVGANRIDGGAGNDTILSGGGADTLIGGAGADVLTGGADGNQDVFLFTARADTGLGSLADTITDFHHGSDIISLRGLDASTALAGDQNFAFGGTRATANGIWLVDVGTTLVVCGDTNGDRLADFQIRLQGVDLVTAADFVL